MHILPFGINLALAIYLLGVVILAIVVVVILIKQEGSILLVIAHHEFLEVVPICLLSWGIIPIGTGFILYSIITEKWQSAVTNAEREKANREKTISTTDTKARIKIQ